MTKEELENSVFWKALPPDTRIVFNTALRGEDCMPLRKEDLAFRSEIEGCDCTDKHYVEVTTTTSTTCI